MIRRCDRRVSFDYSSVRLADSVAINDDVKQAICFSSVLDKEFNANHANTAGLIKWQFWGTPEGIMRKYPGHPYVRKDDVRISSFQVTFSGNLQTL